MLQFDKRQIKILAILGVGIVGLVSFVIFKDRFPNANEFGSINLVSEDPSSTDETQKQIDNTESEDRQVNVDPKTIKIYITGQVQNPGVIEVPSGCRLNEAIEIAGGFLADADLLRINLAIRVQDEGMYLIPKIGEQAPELDSSNLGGQEDTDKVNINTADESRLQTLPRIGPVIARNIIEYREQNGPFESKEDLMNVPRIGEKTFEGLKDLIIVK